MYSSAARATGLIRFCGMMFPGNGSCWKRPFPTARRVNGLKIWYCGPSASSSEKSPVRIFSLGTVGVPLLRGRASWMPSNPYMKKVLRRPS